MAITLVGREVTSGRILMGHDYIPVSAGQSLKMETSPAGSEHLDALVPEGKKWVAEVTFNIIETDV